MAKTEMAADAALLARARKAYELGRLRWALRILPAVLLAGAAAVACGRPLDMSCLLCGALFALGAGLLFYGGPAARAVRPGLWAGVPALALPLLVRTLGHVCLGPSCMQLCMPACILGGVAAGVAIGLLGAREERPLPFMVPALVIAALLGSLGCAIAGLAGVLGMLAGLAAGLPILVTARR